MNKNLEISIILPTIGRKKILDRTISHLLKAIKSFKAEVIIVNDSEKELELQNIEENIKLLNNPGSGAASARNYGISNSSSDLLLFVDDDIIINEHNIKRTIELHKEKLNKGFNFFWIYPPDLISKLPQSNFGKYILNHLIFSNTFRLDKEINSESSLIKMEGLTSQYFSISKKIMESVGGYDENIPHAGIEDLLLYKKLAEQGTEIFLSMDDIVFHNEADRLDIEKVLDRYRKGAYTRRIASNMGFSDLKTDLSLLEKGIAEIMIPFKRFILGISAHIRYGFFYKKIVNLLLMISTYQGFYKDRIND